MLEWGGENIEQSLRIWLCGGEIISVKKSKIGHIFSRPQKEHDHAALVARVQMNQVRAARAWLDDYFDYFYEIHSEIRKHPEESIEDRLALKEKLNCVSFDWFVKRFKTAMERHNLLPHNFVSIRQQETGLCLSRAPQKSGKIMLEPCDIKDRSQHWLLTAGGRMILNRFLSDCISWAGWEVGLRDTDPTMETCEWLKLFPGKDYRQFWHVDNAEGFSQILSYQSPDIATKGGNDELKVPRSKIRGKSFCLDSMLLKNSAFSSDSLSVTVEICRDQKVTQIFEVLRIYENVPFSVVASEMR